MPLLLCSEERALYSITWSSLASMPEVVTASVSDRRVLTHEDEATDSIPESVRGLVVSIPKSVFLSAQKAVASGRWSVIRGAYETVAPLVPPLPNPLDELPPRKRRQIDRKLQRLSNFLLSPSNRREAAAAMAKGSLGRRSNHTRGAALVQCARTSARRVQETNRMENETLWQYFSRRYGSGTIPSDLPGAMDVQGAFVGVELEFVPPISYADDDDDDDQGAYSTLDYSPPFGVAMVRDGSVRTNDGEAFSGYNEAIALIRPPHWKRLETLCRDLQDAGCEVNDTCGLHVHIDVRHLTWADLRERVIILVESLPVLSMMVRPRRVTSAHAHRYCRFGVSPSLGDPDEHYDSHRYWAINLCSLRRQGTIEVRLHQGTLDPTVVVGWATLIRHVVLHAKHALHTLCDLDKALTELQLAGYKARLGAMPSDELRFRRAQLVSESRDWGVVTQRMDPGGLEPGPPAVSELFALPAPRAEAAPTTLPYDPVIVSQDDERPIPEPEAFECRLPEADEFERLIDAIYQANHRGAGRTPVYENLIQSIAYSLESPPYTTNQEPTNQI